MSPPARSPSDDSAPELRPQSRGTPEYVQDGEIDLRDLFRRVGRGIPQILGLGAIGLVIAAVAWLAASPFLRETTSARVIFSFNGYAKGEYPDHSKFQADDLRAPNLVAAALQREGLKASQDFQSKVRAAITVEGIIPSDVVKARDQQRAAGQTPPPYIPDEYSVTLSLPRHYPLSRHQRERFLTNLVTAYEEQFESTYAKMPVAFGNAFQTLENADYPEYEFVLEQEVQNITSFLQQLLGGTTSDVSQTFRSRTTGLSFSDLLEQTQLFSQIQLNQTLGLIYEYGLSRNRATALVKMNYYLRTLEDQDQKALQDQQVVDNLLTKAQEHVPGYVLGVKTAAQQQPNSTPIIDQGLINSLLANDAYNFLVRKALTAGLSVKKIEAEKAQLLERRKNLETFLKKPPEDQSAIVAQVQKSLSVLKKAYDTLITNIRETYNDYARQQYADAVRISMQPHTASPYKPLAVDGIIGLCLGLAAGGGLSLLGIYLGKKS